MWLINRTSLGLVMILSGAVQAMDFRGQVGGEHRQFVESAVYPDTRDSQPSVSLEGEFYQPLTSRSNLTLTLFARADNVDSARSRTEIREAKWRYQADQWDVTAGVARVNWGVVESQRLVDVVNQRDWLEDITGNTRLGQPMLHGRWFKGAVTWEGLLMSGFRQRRFPHAPARLRYPLKVDTDNARYQSSRGRGQPDVAIRGSSSLGGWDLGVYGFHGTNRDPRLLREQDRLIPYYELMSQFGFQVQYTREATLFKTEMIYRRTDSDRYSAGVLGLEHTFFQLLGDDTDLSVLVEYNFDERGRDATSVLQNDLFLGLRMVSSGVSGAQALLGVYYDLDQSSRYGRFQASRRFGENWRAKLEYYGFASDQPRDPLYVYRREDFLLLGLDYFF